MNEPSETWDWNDDKMQFGLTCSNSLELYFAFSNGPYSAPLCLSLLNIMLNMLDCGKILHKIVTVEHYVKTI